MNKSIADSPSSCESPGSESPASSAPELAETAVGDAFAAIVPGWTSKSEIERNGGHHEVVKGGQKGQKRLKSRPVTGEKAAVIGIGLSLPSNGLNLLDPRLLQLRISLAVKVCDTRQSGCKGKRPGRRKRKAPPGSRQDIPGIASNLRVSCAGVAGRPSTDLLLHLLTPAGPPHGGKSWVADHRDGKIGLCATGHFCKA
jgi:hypothetical protein